MFERRWRIRVLKLKMKVFITLKFLEIFAIYISFNLGVCLIAFKMGLEKFNNWSSKLDSSEEHSYACETEPISVDYHNSP